MNLNWDKMDPEVVEERRRMARVHLEFCAKLYKIQQESGRYFLHEHPRSAASWQEETMKKMCQSEGVLTVDADQCMFGLTTEGPDGAGRAQMQFNSLQAWMVPGKVVILQPDLPPQSFLFKPGGRLSPDPSPDPRLQQQELAHASGLDLMIIKKASTH